MVKMGPYRVGAYEQLLGDDFVSEPEDQKPEDLNLAGSQVMGVPMIVNLLVPVLETFFENDFCHLMA